MNKFCKVCSKEKPLAEFHKRASSKDGHYNKCKPCAIAERKASPSYVERALEHRLTAIRKKHAYLMEYLSSHPCVDCGEADPDVLEFDHVRGTKVANVSTLVAHSWEKLEAEIAKCDVRCCNCHKKVTLARLRLRERPYAVRSS